MKYFFIAILSIFLAAFIHISIEFLFHIKHTHGDADVSDYILICSLPFGVAIDELKEAIKNRL